MPDKVSKTCCCKKTELYEDYSARLRLLEETKNRELATTTDVKEQEEIRTKFKRQRELTQAGLYDANGNRRLCARVLQQLFDIGEDAERAFQCNVVSPKPKHGELHPLTVTRLDRFVLAGLTGKPSNRADKEARRLLAPG
ncbi:hypothetical protein PAPYR_12148 [Paratrimastix pyriformis]|uniref:Uncharacterized protein n=1 Tax=Paratrimastix pyriformis TaxID=342808 RepID=A0ABQ8U984_9EUKA|nr:hypothetical protein PAPYR_12148 [Paratrimastix pyriformis]